MKIIFDGLRGLIVVALILGLSLLVCNYLLEFLFIVIDYNPLLGGALAISFLIIFSLIGGLAKTREYFPGIKRLILKENENDKKEENQTKSDPN